MNEKLFEQVKNILVSRFAINPASIHLQTNLQKELKLDSMDALDLLLAINETFSIRLPEQSLENINTISDLLEAIVKNKRGI
ncbi:MAG: acyl carrier protein [Gammaproteobacteria bacterium]|nr:acyl carrier protein [Gammaproteobacteria bacterium]